jgi:hypothetical protein
MYQNGEKFHRIATELPNGLKIYKLAVLYSKRLKICQPFPIQGPPKFTQIAIFGLKIYHLATRARTEANWLLTTPKKTLS